MSCTNYSASHAQHADFVSQCRNLLHIKIRAVLYGNACVSVCA